MSLRLAAVSITLLNRATRAPTHDTAVDRSMHASVFMQLRSPAFRDGEEIPPKYTCDGDDISPPLEWSDVPVQAKSLALIVDDPDAPDPAAPQRTWVHWVLVDLPTTLHGLREDSDKVARAGLNDWRHVGWGGPCPPIGRHRYVFKLYALDRVLELARPTKQDVERAMAGHVLAEARLVGTYAKQPG